MIQARRLRTALILDDEAERRSEMCAGLADFGVVSEEAATLEEAIHLLDRSSPDLVLCDMVLCDPPGAPNPAVRGYLAVCYALERHPGSVVVQASTQRRWTHPGAVLANWRVEEVADLVYGFQGVQVPPGRDDGCPWKALRDAEAASPASRADAVRRLVRLPVIQELGSSAELGAAFEALEEAGEAGEAGRNWEPALAAAWAVLFPGRGHGA